MILEKTRDADLISEITKDTKLGTTDNQQRHRLRTTYTHLRL